MEGKDNLYILLYDDIFYLRNEFLLRDYLREHPKLVDEYGEVKERAFLETFIKKAKENKLLDHIIELDSEYPVSI